MTDEDYGYYQFLVQFYEVIAKPENERHVSINPTKENLRLGINIATLRAWIYELVEYDFITVDKHPEAWYELSQWREDLNADYYITVKPSIYDWISSHARGYNDPENLTRPRVKERLNRYLTFDSKNATIEYGHGEQKLQLTENSLEYFVCKITFRKRHSFALEDDIIEESGNDTSNKRAVYDACMRLNEKTKYGLGIQKMLIFRAGRIRLNKLYQ